MDSCKKSCRRKFTAEPWNILFEILLIDIVSYLIVSVAYGNMSRGFVIAVVMSVCCLYIVITKGFPLAIIVDQQSISMIVIYWKFFSRKRMHYHYRDMTATYEPGESRTRSKIFRLRSKENKIVLKISPSLTGWSAEQLIDLQQMLTLHASK